MSAGIRWVCAGNTGDSNEPVNKFSEDLEPEYVSFNEDDTLAFIVLQASAQASLTVGTL